MKYVLAISGGVDSVVLLDMAAKGAILPAATGARREQNQLVVCHIDHGIRSDSGDDRRFCEGLARQYGLEFTSTELKLGPDASEELAREKRYEFIFSEAKTRAAIIVTAHHADDMVGSIAINLHRGTGWRGLAVLSRAGIERPLLARGMRKADVYRYALEHHLEWVEDSTNADVTILRNSLRGNIFALEDTIVARISDLRVRQIELSAMITAELDRLNDIFRGERYPYTMIDSAIAVELLRRYIETITGMKPTHVETERILLAIKVNRPGTVLQLSGFYDISFGRYKFIVQASDR